MHMQRVVHNNGMLKDRSRRGLQVECMGCVFMLFVQVASNGETVGIIPREIESRHCASRRLTFDNLQGTTNGLHSVDPSPFHGVV